MAETLEPKELASKLGVSPKRLRAFLRAEYPRPAAEMGERWEISVELAKEVENAYKAKKLGVRVMEKCKACGREFEPLPLPELPKFFGIENPHKLFCPRCALEGVAAAATFAIAVLKEFEKKR